MLLRGFGVLGFWGFGEQDRVPIDKVGGIVEWINPVRGGGGIPCAAGGNPSDRCGAAGGEHDEVDGLVGHIVADDRRAEIC